MEILGDIKMFSSFLIYAYNFFYKHNLIDKNIIYIDSNKKIFDISEGEKIFNYSKNNKTLMYQKVKNRYSLKDYQHHLFHINLRLYLIKKNLTKNNSLIYGGFCSPFFAIYDAYIIGDNVKIQFVDYNKYRDKYYLINFKKDYSEPNINFLGADEQINLIISSSFEIKNTAYNCNFETYRFSKKISDYLTSDYLNEVYSYVKCLLDKTLNTKVKVVNIYIAAQQPINFVIGLAIQKYHPSIRIYEFLNNEYSFVMELNTNNTLIKEV